jgi:hypothetical protein
MAGSKNSKHSQSFDLFLVILLLAALSSASAFWFFRHGYSLYYGDAEAHLNIARRIVDSRMPGYFQIGTVWLPLPHVLMLLLRCDAACAWKPRRGPERDLRAGVESEFAVLAVGSDDRGNIPRGARRFTVLHGKVPRYTVNWLCDGSGACGARWDSDAL